VKYTKEQYIQLGERFSKSSLTGKLILIKNNQELFQIESDGYNLRLRLLDDEAMCLGLDSYFSFPEFVDFSFLRDVLRLVDINNLKELN